MIKSLSSLSRRSITTLHPFPASKCSSVAQSSSLFSTSLQQSQSSSSTTTTTTTSSSSNSSMSIHRQNILHASLDHVHQYGWTKDAIAQGVLSSKLPLSLTGLVTPKELISFFMTDCNSQLRTYLKENMLQSNPSHSNNNNNSNVNEPKPSRAEQIENAIQYRLQMVIPYIKSNKWHEGMAIGALENTVSTSYELEELVSIIIDETETSGTSPSLTTTAGRSQVERMALGAVYVATELHLLADTSEGCKDTWTFLSHRMKEYEHLFLNGGSSSSMVGGIPIPLPSLPDSNTILGASAVAASLGSAVVSLAFPGVRTVVDKVMTSSSSQILPTLQTFMQSNNINIMDPTTNPGNLNHMNMNMMNQSQGEKTKLEFKGADDEFKDLPPFDHDIGLDTMKTK